MDELAAGLDSATFEAAWRRVRRSPGAGIDGVHAHRFALALAENLAALRDAMLSGSYRPEGLLRREIPKEGGVRRLGVPTVADRIAQSAVLELASPRLDSRLLPNVHGYRPGSSPEAAVGHLLAQVGARPWLEIVHADITSLFDALPHALVLQAVDDAWSSPLWRSLNRLWLRRWADSPGRGVPQGAQLSPLLANLALDRGLDRALCAGGPSERPRPGALPWERWSAEGLRLPRARVVADRGESLRSPIIAWILYGDDLVLATAQPGAGLRLLSWLDGLVRELGMTLSPRKTVIACGGAAGRPLPRPVLGVPLCLRPGPGGWTLVRAGAPHPTFGVKL